MESFMYILGFCLSLDKRFNDIQFVGTTRFEALRIMNYQLAVGLEGDFFFNIMASSLSSYQTLASAAKC